MIVAVLLATAHMADIDTHGVSHWIILGTYAVCSVALAFADLKAFGEGGLRLFGRGDDRDAEWLAWASTLLNAGVAVYVVVEYLLVGSNGTEETSAAVSRLPAFLLLLQTGLSMRVWHTALFASLVTAAWGGMMLFVLLFPESGLLGPYVTLDEEVPGLLTFIAASLVVIDGVRRLRSAVTTAFRLERERTLLTRFVPESVAEELSHGGGIGAVKERHVCLLALDIRGFSTFTRAHDPEEVVRTLLDVRSITYRAVTEAGGIVDKYIGDGVLAQFVAGSPKVQARAALACVKAIHVRLAAMNRHRKDAGRSVVRVTMALHAGDVLIGVFDDGHRAEFTVLGRPMNLVARIEARAKAADLTIAASGDFLCLLMEAGSGGSEWVPVAPSGNEPRQAPALFTIVPEDLWPTTSMKGASTRLSQFSRAQGRSRQQGVADRLP